jgi:GNAT superfamily N-acetyltransferase
VRAGTDVVIRRPAPTDRPAIEAMFARCSVESRYARFHAPLAAIPASHLADLFASSGQHEAWVGTLRSEPATVVALGSWAAHRADAELALLVEDAWQRRGVGSRLLEVLAARTQRAGYCRLTASVLTEARHVVRMLRAVVGPTAVRVDGHVSHVVIDRCED